MAYHPLTSQQEQACRYLPAGALAVLAPRPAAGPALAFLQLLLGPANAAFSGDLLLGILDQMNSLRAKGVTSFQAASAAALAISRPALVYWQAPLSRILTTPHRVAM